MKNLNEPLKRDEDTSREEMMQKADTADVIPFERAAEQRRTGALLPKRQVDELQTRWATVQTSFVDEPRKAVEDADKLVASAIKQIEEVFFAERSNLEKQWSRGDEVSTEHLRVALQHYRDFFDRLLSMRGGQ